MFRVPTPWTDTARQFGPFFFSVHLEVGGQWHHSQDKIHQAFPPPLFLHTVHKNRNGLGMSLELEATYTLLLWLTRHMWLTWSFSQTLSHVRSSAIFLTVKSYLLWSHFIRFFPQSKKSKSREKSSSYSYGTVDQSDQRGKPEASGGGGESKVGEEGGGSSRSSKKKKKKMQKVNPAAMLGFTVNAAERPNMGEIQTVRDALWGLVCFTAMWTVEFIVYFMALYTTVCAWLYCSFWILSLYWFWNCLQLYVRISQGVHWGIFSFSDTIQNQPQSRK